MPDEPLSTPLSQLLIAFTIELDNEFERRLAEVAEGRYLRVSLVMWSNFLRFVGDGITVGDLPDAAGLPKARMLSTLGGMERWRYVFVEAVGAAPSEHKRDGWGSARGLRSEWLVRPTPVGLNAREIWPPLLDEVERRWEERFGSAQVDELRRSLAAAVEHSDLQLPEYLPIVTGTNGFRAELSAPKHRALTPTRLAALLSQVLLAYTLDFERLSELSLPLAANVVRVLDETGLDVRDIPSAAAVSREATSMALTFLGKKGFVVVERSAAGAPETVARLTAKGRDAQSATSTRHEKVADEWLERLGGDVRRLRAALRSILEQREKGGARLALGLEPDPDGWRASGRYAEQTAAMLGDPHTGLPQYPMVLHRGGWPDGS